MDVHMQCICVWFLNMQYTISIPCTTFKHWHLPSAKTACGFVYSVTERDVNWRQNKDCEPI